MERFLALRVPALVMLLALQLAGCGPFLDGPDGVNRFLAPGAKSQVNAALAAMARGDYGEAEWAIRAALSADKTTMAGVERDPLLLLAAATLYQTTNRPQQAITYYRELLQRNPRGYVAGSLWGSLQPRPIVEVARENLRLLESGGIGRPSAPPPDSKAQAQPSKQSAPSPPLAGETGAELEAIAQRFALMTRLLELGLVTETEWGARRNANIGLLTPLTAPRPPAVGLEKPPPDEAQVTSRLRALRDAVEGRGMTVGQHEIERKAILDGIMPSDPRVRRDSPRWPSNAEEVTSALARLDGWKKGALINEEEYMLEKQAIERSGQSGGKPTPPPVEPAPDTTSKPNEPPPFPTASVANPAATLQSGRGPLQVVPSPSDPQQPDASASNAAGSGGVVAVLLSSYESEAQARMGWEEIKRKHPDVSALQPKVTRITTQDNKVLFRLNAGPLPDRQKAEELCSKLQGQSCEPVFLGG
ncbi:MULTISPECIES: SPOR domain-containing protein [unclassified Haematospirillum]|uniref:SPOR domain-containing protein n=1 Tax=unclassified Haematospirillum TaxID=2622088 RepID=UPI00143948D2|nr:MULTISPECIES: SPOR domain-containing protein [unclassified Haematospirillum]NKD54494.1 hypothetical protein [Haematospirillum sp. H4890]NKD74894.1 hypothetical protein [Haematospirillum sp. H4485]NKD88103.1 hypothetical protein [Haematospirillum sp. 15-248]